MKKIKTIIGLLFLTALNHLQAQNLQYGLQACYPLDCNTDNYAASGSIMNGTGFNVSCTTGVSGVANTAYAFTGATNSYIQLPNSSLIKTNNSMSFSGWVRFNNTSNSQYIVFAQNSCFSYFEGYALLGAVVGSNFRLTVVKSSSACSPSTQHVVSGVTNLNANQWYHVGFYAGTDSLKMFLDGVVEGTPISSTTAFNYANTNVYLGGTNSGIFNAPLNGRLDNVRFYSRKLTNSEFKLLKDTNPACNVTGEPLLTDSLQACYPLDCNITNMATTGSALDGLTASNVTCATDRLGNANSAYAFSGATNSYIQLPNDSRIKPTTAVSVSGWVRFNSSTNGQYLVFAKNACSIYFEGYALAATKVGSALRLQVVKSSAACSAVTQHAITGSTNLSINTWYHVGFYAGTDSLKLFLNGNPEGTPVVSSTAFSYDGSTNVYLGGTNSGIFNAPLDGRLDDIRFYNRKLYNSEFKKIYNASPQCNAAGIGLLNGLQACYPLNCNAINYAPTTSGVPPSLDGTLYNVACDTGHVGDLNGAFKFSGATNSYIEFPNDSRIKPAGTNGISVTLWAKLDVLNSAQFLVFAKNTCTSWFEGYSLTASNISGQIRYHVVKSSSSTAGCGTQAILNSTNLYSPYIWHHITFCMDNSVIKLYVDGTLDNTLSSSVVMNYDNSNVYLGGTNSGLFNAPLNGSIDNVRFYNRIISQSEITQIRSYDPSCDALSGCGGYPSNCKDAVLGVQSIDINSTAIELYPNPSSGTFNIRNAKDLSLVVYDINGKMVPFTTSQINETTSEISLLDNATGLYFVKMKDDKGNIIQTGKIIVTH